MAFYAASDPLVGHAANNLQILPKLGETVVGRRRRRRQWMARPQREGLRALTSEETATLRRVSQATSERVDRVQRARALLAVARGTSFAAAARDAGFRSGTTVALLVGRFNRCGLTALTIAPGRGRRPTYDATA